jgi:hypothetical protein
LVGGLAVVLALLGCPTAARANTYLFSFTTADLMSALQTSRGTAEYSESGYYAIFVQPDPAQITNFTVTSANTPNPTDPNVWDASVIDDPSSPFLGYGVDSCTSNCTWAGFYKDSTYTGTPGHTTPNQPDVTIVSGANNPGTNIFLGHSWFDTGSPPYSWGGETRGRPPTILFNQVINTVMPGSDVFSFALTTSQALSGTYQLVGYASALISGDPGSMTGDTKDSAGLAFSMDVTLGSTPEPATWTSLVGGMLLMFPLILRNVRKARQNTRNTQAPTHAPTAHRDRGILL